MRSTHATLQIAQEPDSNDELHPDPQDLQEMTITITDAGGGLYPVITTTRWAVSLADLPRLALAAGLMLAACWVAEKE